ncbi:unnamed protein product [Microthlaspi erraticum]|uniref:NYN domain-containing protein n=1 Tax=Microthlaspi erraticum TaxID=1685480 RepID=A0A6D2JGG1_9BRAS|nr:unnamed protein product [Microthlaspi erraticum]
MASVFWDVEDFPFPAGWRPDEIYEKIESAFSEKGVEGEMSVWAYVDDKEGSWGGDFLRKNTWESSIYFLPGGKNKSARSDRMLHDIHLWAMDSPAPADLILVSGKVKKDKGFTRRLRGLDMRNYRVFLITPRETTVAPAKSSCEWPKFTIRWRIRFRPE